MFRSAGLSGGGRTLLLVNEVVSVGVNGDDDNVGEHVDGADDVHGLGILHGDLLGDLHHPEDDDQVGAACSVSSSSLSLSGDM